MAGLYIKQKIQKYLVPVYRNTKPNQAKCFCSKQQTRREKPIQQKQKAGIVTSLNDTTLTRENTPLGSRMKWRMESTSGLVPSKTLFSI